MSVYHHLRVIAACVEGAAERRSKNAEQRAQIIEMRRAQHNAAPGCLAGNTVPVA